MCKVTLCTPPGSLCWTAVPLMCIDMPLGNTTTLDPGLEGRPALGICAGTGIAGVVKFTVKKNQNIVIDVKQVDIPDNFVVTG